MAERQKIMLSQILHVAHFESRFFRVAQHGRDWDHLAVGENVNIGEGGMRRFGPVTTAPNAMIEKHSSRPEHGKSVAKIFRKLAFAYMLHHSYAGNFVELAQLTGVAVVEKFNLAMRSQTCFFNSTLPEH